jgi:tape measure domain-containing protein
MADLNTQLVFGANTAGAEAGVRTVKRSLKELADTATSAGKSIEGVGDRAGKSLEGMGDGAEVAARKIQRDTNSMKGSLQRYLSTLEAGSKDSRKYWESMADFKGIDKTALRPLLDQLDAYNAKAKGAQETTTSWVGSLGRMGASAAGVAAVAATAGVAAKAMFEASASAERLRTMLDFSTGGNSGKEIEYLRDVTYRLGLEFASTAKAYGQFSAAAKGTTLEGDKARAVFESVAKASAVMGLSASDTSGVLLALQQMLSKGTVSAEELRGQLGERLPGSFQVAAKAMGVTTAELGKMLEQGEVIADDFLPKFAAALEKNIGGASEKAAQRLDASVNRVATAWERLKQNGGDSGTSSFMAGQYEILADGFNGISEAMERARASGSGFIGQMVSGAAAAAKFANPLQAVSYSAIETGNALKQAEAEFAALQKRGDVMGGNIYYKAEMANLAALIKELKAAQAEKQKLATGAAPNMNEGVNASGRAREAYNSQRAKDEEAANAFRLKQSGVPESYVKEMTELIRLNQLGLITGKEYDAQLKTMQDTLLKKTGVTKASNAAANQEQNTYESLIASIRAKIEEDKLELAGGAALTESQRLRIKLDQDLLSGKIKLGSAREAEVRALIEEKATSEAQVTARRALNKANIEAGQAREKYLASLESGVEKIRDDIAAQQEATARMGLTKDAIAALDGAKLEMLATDLELQAIKALDRNLDQQTYDSLKEQAKLYRDLAAAKKDGAAKEIALDLEKANEDAAKDAAKEWERAAEDINRSLTDALLRGFESGKGFAKNFVDTMKNLFSTLVLRPIISAIINPVAGALTGALGLAGPAAAAASGGGALSGASTLFSGIGALAGNFGAGLTTGFSGLVAGNLGSTLGLGTGLIGSGATAGGIGTIVGALGPIALGIGALVALARATKGETRTGGQFGVAFDGSVTNNRRGQTYTMVGQQFDRDFTNGQNIALTNGQAYRLEGDPVAQESAIRDAVAGTARGINGFLEALGSTARLAGFSAGLETSGKGRGGVFAGGRFADGRTFGESGEGDNYAGTLYEAFSTNSPDFKTALENFTLDLKQSTIQALQTVTDIPETIKKQLKDIDAEALSDEAANALLESINAQIVGVGQLRDAFDQMGLEGLSDIAFDAAAGLAEVSGGFDKLLGNLQTYYTNFFTGEEQRANLQRSLAQQLSDLGLQLPDINASNARDQFRALVSAAEKDMSESGRKTYATLLALSGAFASITDAADGAAEAVKKQQDAVYSQFQRALGRDRDGLNSQASALQDTISGIADAVDTLRSNARDLYQTVDGTRNMLAAQGMVYIEQALSGVRAGASVADYSGLSDAISAARSGIDGGRYSTQFARERDALVLAGQLSQLADSGELQLSFEERQLRAVNEQLEYLNTLDKRAEELVNGTTTLTGTVQSYFDQLLAILKPADPEQGQGAQPGGAFAGVGGGGGGVMGTPVDQDALLKARIDQQLRFGEEKGLAFNDPAVLASINAALYGSGATNADIARLFDIPKEDVDALFKGAGIARFDIGTNYVPRDMLAYIHEGEAVVPKAYNPAANPGASGGSNADLAAAVNRLAEQNAILAARLEAIEKNTQLMPQMGRQFNDVTNGGTVLRSKAIA